MPKYQDEQWLEQILADCFKQATDHPAEEKTLAGFKILAASLACQLERKAQEIKILWQEHPQSAELKDKLDDLTRQLFYLSRFCQNK